MKIADMNVSTRLATGFSIIVILLLLVAGIGSWRLQSISSAVSTMVNDVMQKERLFSDWAANTNVNGARTIAVAESSDPARQKEIQEKIKATSARITEIQASLAKLEKNSEETALYEKVAAKRKTYTAARDVAFKERASNEENSHKLMRVTVEPALDDYVASIKSLSAYQAGSIASMADETKKMSYASTLWLIILGAVATLFGIVVAVIITNGVKRQLGCEPSHAISIANRIAAGDLSSLIDTQAGDQTSMLHAIKMMRDSIAIIINQVRSASNLVATASNEIAAGNLDLSSRTEQQASSLEETASSMEELTSTVKQNADNARHANRLAASASDVAVKGGSVVAQVVDTMESINASSKKIADIIGVIDSIAFQTNILALNAAVEAARAGEQGRGFAVVATEVRNLAHRSAAAAREIKTLIGDSVDKVEIGTQLVDQAGATMQEIVESVKRVTDIMNEISSASAEQTSGIEQINQAIMQMDQVTQQNAALVEEAAAAAASLQYQAGNLAQVISVFNTGDMQAPEPSLAPKHPGQVAPVVVAQPSRPRPSRNTNPPKHVAKAPATTESEWEEF